MDDRTIGYGITATELTQTLAEVAQNDHEEVQAKALNGVHDLIGVDDDWLSDLAARKLRSDSTVLRPRLSSPLGVQDRTQLFRHACLLAALVFVPDDDKNKHRKLIREFLNGLLDDTDGSKARQRSRAYNKLADTYPFWAIRLATVNWNKMAQPGPGQLNKAILQHCTDVFTRQQTVRALLTGQFIPPRPPPVDQPSLTEIIANTPPSPVTKREDTAAIRKALFQRCSRDVMEPHLRKSYLW